MNFFRLSILMCLLISNQISNAQKDTLDIKNLSTKGTAIGISAPDLIDEFLPLIPGLGSSSRETLEEQSLKSYMMPPRKMSEHANPECYALASLLEFYANYDENYKVNLSPEYLSLNLMQAEKFSLQDAFKFLIMDGTVSAAIMPYNSTSIPRAVFATEKFKINNYLHLFKKEMKMRQKVFQTKKALMRGNPVLIEMKVSDSFQEIKNTRYWVPANTKVSHQMPFIVIGFDQDLEAFEILSFWGNRWGSDGYLWIDYEDFGKYVEEGFVIMPTTIGGEAP